MSVRLELPKDPFSLPKPDIGGEWQAFWSGTARGELLIQACTNCGHRQFYPRAICTACGEEPAWLKTEGVGTLHTFSVIRQNLVSPFKDMLPYVLAIVDLKEGVRMMSNIVDCDLEDVEIDMPLEVFMVSAGEELFIPYWRPR